MPKGKKYSGGSGTDNEMLQARSDSHHFSLNRNTHMFWPAGGGQEVQSHIGPQKLGDGGGIRNYLASSPEDQCMFLAGDSFYVFTGKHGSAPFSCPPTLKLSHLPIIKFIVLSESIYSLSFQPIPVQEVLFSPFQMLLIIDPCQ